MNRFMMTAAMAVALSAAAVSAGAQTPPPPQHDHDKGGNHGGPPPGGGNHGAPPPGGGNHGGPPPGGGNHGGPPPGGPHPGGGGPQVFHPGGAPAGGNPGGGQQHFNGGNQGGGQQHVNGAAVGVGQQHFNGGNPGGGGQRFVGAAGGVQRGGPPGTGFRSHGLRPQDRGRVAFSAGAFPHVAAARQRFHVRPQAYPGGWYNRSWGYGDFLPFGWFAPSFYLDWGDYGLPEPPVGCEWVREGADAVLVDVWTGEVLSVYRDVFW